MTPEKNGLVPVLSDASDKSIVESDVTDVWCVYDSEPQKNPINKRIPFAMDGRQKPLRHQIRSDDKLNLKWEFIQLSNESSKMCHFNETC